ncbi:hypothetical protein RC74_20850 [Falsihalocynthiibacter arcticus]|uniref:Uncharacterized protein n=1 Tax=Falsihalocynthiibacter arcticus TaxID=1579316 RepID=A0A126V5F1_9RHOB|nr:hypothetical protein RC74_20850 [Falsihalocynthiibacter arcticus]
MTTVYFWLGPAVRCAMHEGREWAVRYGQHHGRKAEVRCASDKRQLNGAQSVFFLELVLLKDYHQINRAKRLIA